LAWALLHTTSTGFIHRDLLIDAKPLPLHTELKGRQLIKSGYMKKHAPLNTEVTVKQKGQEHTDSMK